MNNKTFPWILIDKANMSKPPAKFKDAGMLACSMMKSGTVHYRNFNEFIVIKNESTIVGLAREMAGVGGDAMSIHHEVVKILENS